MAENEEMAEGEQEGTLEVTDAGKLVKKDDEEPEFSMDFEEQ